MEYLFIYTLLLIMGGVTQCQAWKKITVIEGSTLSLTCPRKSTNWDDHVEWRNQNNLLMFFNRKKVLKDPRSQVTLSHSEYSLSIANITFRDRGNYKCQQYSYNVFTKKYQVIVVSRPKLEMTEHEDKTLIKCSASAFDNPPKLSWLLESGLEIEAQPNYHWENVSKKYTSISVLHVKAHKRKVAVKCLVQHLALHGQKLMDFIHIENHAIESRTTTEYFSTTLGSTETLITPTHVPHINESEATNEESTHIITTSHNITKVNEATESTVVDAPANFSTFIPLNITPGVGDEDKERSKHTQKRGNSPLLVLLVTCLIICLVVVLAFFLLRLRRAHIAWKKENEESDQSVESSRSKSSNEEKQKQAQEQRPQGYWNTSFTKYKVEEVSVSEPRSTTTTTTVQITDEKPVCSNQNIPKSCIKETEL